EADSGDWWDWGWSTFDSTAAGSTSFTTSGQIDVTALVKSWVDNSLADQAVAFVGDESGGSYTKKDFYAELEVTYVASCAPPAATANPQPPDNGVIITEDPTLSVDAVTPPPGDSVE